MKKIIIYSTPTCAYCHMTKDYFKENNIEYTDYNVAEDTEKQQEMIKKSGQMGVPVIIFSDEDGSNEEIVIGFNKEKIKGILGL